MIPAIFPLVSANDAVKVALGTKPVRFFPFGEAPEGVTLPYATWQGIGGSPENYINETPDIDRMSLQIDVWGADASTASAAATALRNVVEPRAHIVGWRAMGRDDTTGRWRIAFDVDWWQSR